jgi:ribosomal protein S18 acetylase RimI-like enzyme
MVIEVRRATFDDLDRSSEVLGLAFADYPWTRWTVDHEDHVDRISGLQRLALEQLGLPFGEVWLGSLDGVVESVAVWMDSATQIPSSTQEQVAGATAALSGARSELSLAAEAQVSAWRPRHPHLYLATIGTTPRAQRRGLGTRVLAPMLARADRARTDAFLETSSPSNVDFYEGLGFAVIDHCQIAGGGPDVWAMLRQPR